VGSATPDPNAMVDVTVGLTTLEAAAAMRERHVQSANGRVEDTGAASSWEDEITQSVSALAEGLWSKVRACPRRLVWAEGGHEELDSAGCSFVAQQAI
jgi:hypothetical protein